MKRSMLLKSISAAVLAGTIVISTPLGVSAQWRQICDNTSCSAQNDTKTNCLKSTNGKVCYLNSQCAIKDGKIKVNGYTIDLSSFTCKSGNCTNKSDKNNTDTVKNITTTEDAITTTTTTDDTSDKNGTEEVNTDKTVDTTVKDTTTKTTTTVETEDTNVEDKAAETTTEDTTNSQYKDASGLPSVTKKYDVAIQNSAENKILELMNEKRVEAGLKPLTMDNTLLDVARYKSNHMIQLNYFSHTNPDGTNWTSWLKSIGYSYTTTAENIAYNSYDAVELFNQWWNSAGHRQNMMNPSYTKVGVGVLYGDGKYMGTQTFSN
ncbi:CAP domain-containing protein [Clostridium sp. BJN0001]|uniref:CAP domain-containing protein n=1 Tax=Clostridium sp. BJN0001 TaxID=2930219 RepID=UPI001FD46ECE|nr:CAP domain-containing protein [Clostridium sp. BJN0001]